MIDTNLACRPHPRGRVAAIAFTATPTAIGAAAPHQPAPKRAEAQRQTAVQMDRSHCPATSARRPRETADEHPHRNRERRRFPAHQRPMPDQPTRRTANFGNDAHCAPLENNSTNNGMPLVGDGPAHLSNSASPAATTVVFRTEHGNPADETPIRTTSHRRPHTTRCGGSRDHVAVMTGQQAMAPKRPNTSDHPDPLTRAPQPPRHGIDQPTENLPIHTQHNSQKTVRI